MFPKDSAFRQAEEARRARLEDYIGVDPPVSHVHNPPQIREAAKTVEPRQLEEWYATLNAATNEMRDHPMQEAVERVRDDIYRHLY